MKLTKDQKKVFYNIFFPALAENLLLRIFHMTDSMMLGQMKDSTLAVAAVGLCGAPVNLIIATTNGFFIGTTATIAWLFGAKEKDRLRSVTAQAGLIALFIAALFSCISIFCAAPIIRFVCGESEAYATALSYFRIISYGHFFQIMTSFITAAFRGIGITKMPLLYNISGGALNVCLNFLLIYGKWGFPELREEGAAWATTISKMVVFLIAVLIFFIKKSPLRPQKGIRLKWDPLIRKRLFPVGLTSFCEQVIAQMGATLSSKIVATLPTNAIAANQVVTQVEGFAWSTGSACMTASTSLFGRSLGEGSEPKARAYLRMTLKCAAICAATCSLIFILFGRQVAALFTNNAALYPLIGRLLIFASINLFPINLHQSTSGAMRGAGDSLAPLLSSMTSLWIFRVLLGYLTVSVLGQGVLVYRICLLLDQSVRLLAVTYFYRTNHWRRHAIKK